MASWGSLNARIWSGWVRERQERAMWWIGSWWVAKSAAAVGQILAAGVLCVSQAPDCCTAGLSHRLRPVVSLAQHLCKHRRIDIAAGYGEANGLPCNGGLLLHGCSQRSGTRAFGRVVGAGE